MKKIIALVVLVISLFNCSYAEYVDITDVIEVYSEGKIISYIKFTAESIGPASRKHNIILLDTKLQELKSYESEDIEPVLFSKNVNVIGNTLYISYSFKESFMKFNYRVYSFDLNLKLKSKVKLTDNYSTLLFDDQGFTKLTNSYKKYEKAKVERYNNKLEKIWENNDKIEVFERSFGKLLTKVDNNILITEINSEDLKSTTGEVKVLGINSLTGKIKFTAQINEGETNVIGIPKVLYNTSKKEYTLVGQYFENIKNVAAKKPIGNYIFKMNYDGKIISKKFNDFKIDFAKIKDIYLSKKFKYVAIYDYEQLLNGNIIFYGVIKMSNFNHPFVAEYNAEYKITNLSTAQREIFNSLNNEYPNLKMYITALDKNTKSIKVQDIKSVNISKVNNDYSLIFCETGYEFTEAQINTFVCKNGVLTMHRFYATHEKFIHSNITCFYLNGPTSDKYMLLKDFKKGLVYEAHSIEEDNLDK